MDHKLLLADDEEGIRKVLGIYLADSGYEVLTAENGLQALDDLPAGAAGHRAHRHPNARHRRHRTAAHHQIGISGHRGIMITGHGDMDLAIESLKFEATDFVTKPINDDVLAIAL